MSEEKKTVNSEKVKQALYQLDAEKRLKMDYSGNGPVIEADISGLDLTEPQEMLVKTHLSHNYEKTALILEQGEKSYG